MLATESPFPIYTDTSGKPLDAGYLYFGQPNQNPETAPVAIYWDAAGTIPAEQPVRTLNGYTVRSGTPALVYTAGDYSLTVRTRDRVLIYHAQTSAAFGNSHNLAQLGANLAATGDTEKGAALVSYSPALAYPADSLGAAARQWLALSTFPGADPTGSTGCDLAINTAISVAKVLRVPLLVDGTFRHLTKITVPSKLALIGSGWTSDSTTGGRSLSCFLKHFNGIGFEFSADDASADGIQFDSVPGTTGDGVAVTGSRVRLMNGGVTNAGGDGVRIGKTESGASSINANCGALLNMQILACGGWGINFDHTNTTTSATFPLGAPDCNAWTVSHVVIGASGQACWLGGIRFGNTIDNVVTHAVIQDNTAGPAIKYTTSARGNVVTAYCEGNGTGPVFDSGAKYNHLRLTQTLITGNEATDNDGTNTIERANSATQGWAANRHALVNSASGGVAEQVYWVDTGVIDAASTQASQSTGTRGRWAVKTRTNGGSRVERLIIDGESAAIFKNLTGVLFGKEVLDTTTAGVQVMDGAAARVNIVNAGTSASTVLSFYNGNGQVGQVSTNGSATTYATSSDYRLKTAVSDADKAAALEAVMAWPIRSFIWKATGAADVGVLAHELQAVKPGAVTGTKDGPETQGVDYSKLVPELVAAVQYLAAQVAELQERG